MENETVTNKPDDFEEGETGSATAADGLGVPDEADDIDEELAEQEAEAHDEPLYNEPEAVIRDALVLIHVLVPLQEHGRDRVGDAGRKFVAHKETLEHWLQDGLPSDS